MRWIALGLGTTLAAAGLAWALVTTGYWPLDDRKQPATAFYALNGAVGEWLLDHAQTLPARVAPGASTGGGGSQAAGAVPEPLSAVELAAAQQTLRNDPRFRGRFRFTAAPAGGSGRG